jgi:hypothetical protein
VAPIADLAKISGGIDVRLALKRTGFRWDCIGAHGQSADCDRMVVALARPGDIDHAVMVGFDEKTECVRIRLRGALAGAASVTGVAALAQDIDRNERTGFTPALAVVEIAQRCQRRCGQE